MQTEKLTSLPEKERQMKRLLLVEDDRELRQMTGDLLCFSCRGLEIVTAENGAQARKVYQEALAQGSPFEVVLTDHHMPEMTGMDFIEWLQAACQEEPERRPSQVVLMTADWEGIDVKRLKTKGVRLLRKPFSFSELTQVLNSLD